MNPTQGGRASWHSYNFALNPAQIDHLSKDLDSVDSLNGSLRIRYNPPLQRQELAEFLSGSDRPANGITRCQSIRSRMDIFPDGSVVSCKFYPEFKVADLRNDSFEEAWNGERFTAVRRTVIEQGLMPACAKCNLLYTRGA